MRDLSTTLSRDNRLGGTERIRAEVLKLGIEVSNRSIRRYRWRMIANCADRSAVFSTRCHSDRRVA